jgi:hypothetical protein
MILKLYGSYLKRISMKYKDDYYVTWNVIRFTDSDSVRYNEYASTMCEHHELLLLLLLLLTAIECHSVAVVLTIVQTNQITINIQK